MDLLIIRKDKGVAITNQIGDIFRTHNIWEYKSPNDGITIDDYFKTVGYAYLYKGLGKTVNEISGDELTASMARDVHPDKLFSVITQSGGKIEQKYPGIYHISGVVNIPTQVIITSELDKEQHVSPYQTSLMWGHSYRRMSFPSQASSLFLIRRTKRSK